MLLLLGGLFYFVLSHVFCKSAFVWHPGHVQPKRWLVHLSVGCSPIFLFFAFFLGRCWKGIVRHSKCASPSSFEPLFLAHLFLVLFCYSGQGGGTTPPSLIVCRQDGRPRWWMSDKRFNGASVARRFLFRHFDGCPFVSDGHRRVAIGHKKKIPSERPIKILFFFIPPAVHVTGISIDWCFFCFI